MMFDLPFSTGGSFRGTCVFILESPFHFQLHLTPVVQGYLGGTGTRGTGSVDQQVNLMGQLWFSIRLRGSGIAVTAWAVLSLRQTRRQLGQVHVFSFPLRPMICLSGVDCFTQWVALSGSRK
jgi:hypothetical protein